MTSRARGSPKHQNRTAWKANAGVKKNDKELGGKLHPYPEIKGVCPRCKSQIEWRRKYGKYKPLIEPAKCHQCSKRAVRDAYHALCPACARERNVCAKCCQRSEVIVGRDTEKERAQQEVLEHALKNLRERDRRTLLRAMNNGVAKEEFQSCESSAKEKKSEDTKNVEDEEDELEDDEECGSNYSEGDCDSLEDGDNLEKEESLQDSGFEKLAIS